MSLDAKLDALLERYHKLSEKIMDPSALGDNYAKISKEYSVNKNLEVNIKYINFVDFKGKPIAKSTLYKVLKTLCDKDLITHLGTERSSTYKLN